MQKQLDPIPSLGTKPKYDARMSGVTAFVLAGGKSSRMGADKAFLEYRGQTLLERALSTLRSLTPEVWIVGERDKFAHFAPVVEDVFRERGPLGGIHAALTASVTEQNVILAIDLPFMSVDFLRFLLEQATATDALVVVPRSQNRFQPLCAVYRKGFGSVAERSMMRGENKIDALFREVETMVIEEAEVVRHGFSPDIFRNLNTPEEFELAKRRPALESSQD